MFPTSWPKKLSPRTRRRTAKHSSRKKLSLCQLVQREAPHVCPSCGALGVSPVAMLLTRGTPAGAVGARLRHSSLSCEFVIESPPAVAGPFNSTCAEGGIVPVKIRRICAPLFACLLVFLTTVAAQDLPTAKPESVGLSAERLERISKTVQRSIDDKRIAGAVTLVLRHGQVAWFKAQGMADRESGKAMRLDTMFRICSMTKPITSVAVMMLYEEGYFLLEDPISKYLPEFKNPKVLVQPQTGESYPIPATREITIRDLLRHTSGLTY